MNKIPSKVKQDFIDHISCSIGLNKREATDVVESFFLLLKDKLINGHSIRLCGLGLFKLIDKKPRLGRNFQTGKYAKVEERRVVTFKSGVKLKHRISIHQTKF